MTINAKTKTVVDALLTDDATTESNFKLGLQDITTELNDTLNEDTSFGGDVSGTYNAIAVTDDSHTHDTRYFTETEINSMFAGNTSKTGYNNTNWDTAYGWGNHGSEGYLTSVAFSNIAGAAVQLSSESFSDNDTSLMTSAAIADYVAGEIPTNVPTTTKQTQWDTAYNAAVAGTSSVNIDSGTIDGVTIGTTTAVTDLRVDNIKIDGNVISSTNTNGDISLTPAGTGEVNISKVDIDSGAIDGVTIGTSSAVTDLRVDNIKVDANTISSTNTNGDIILAPNGSGDVSITLANLVLSNGQGIDFSATSDGAGVDSSELLDDYEEGSWTPVYATTSSNGLTSVTSGSGTSGFYIKIGRLIHIQCYVSTSSVTIGSNSAAAVHIAGLPYLRRNNSSSLGYESSFTVGKASNFQTNFPNQAYSFGSGAEAYILPTVRTSLNGESSSLTAGDMKTTVGNQLRISGTYWTV